MKALRIAIGADDSQWCQRFAAALEESAAAATACNMKSLTSCAMTGCRPWPPTTRCCGNRSRWEWRAPRISRKRIYVLEKHLGKCVVPNYHTIWHFESKVAQSYLFEIERIPTPATLVSFSHEDAARQLQLARMPLVFKQSQGAASKNVRLVRSTRESLRWLRRAFCGEIYRGQRVAGRSRWQTVCRNLGRRWFWEALGHRWRGVEPSGYVYWQEFVPANDADLRITVIGNRYGYGFWRHNRPGDFRASGSGRWISNSPFRKSRCVIACRSTVPGLRFDGL